MSASNSKPKLVDYKPKFHASSYSLRIVR